MLHSEGRSNSGIMYLHCTYILPCTTAALHYYGHHSSADFLMMWYVDHYWEKTLSLLCCIFFLTSLLVPDLCFVCFNIQLSFFLLLFSCGVFIIILFLLFKLLSHWAQRYILDRFFALCSSPWFLNVLLLLQCAQTGTTSTVGNSICSICSVLTDLYQN